MMCPRSPLEPLVRPGALNEARNARNKAGRRTESTAAMSEAYPRICWRGWANPTEREGRACGREPTRLRMRAQVATNVPGIFKLQQAIATNVPTTGLTEAAKRNNPAN
jgi:hypothetical protein